MVAGFHSSAIFCHVHSGVNTEKKVDIGGEKGAQKEHCHCHQKDCNTMMIQNYDYEVQTSYTYILFIFLIFFVTDLIKKMDYVNCTIFNKD